MATITAQAIIDKAEIILQDTTNVRWPAEELLSWLNDGQREIVLRKPDSYVENENQICVSGTKQSIPSDAIMLIDVVRNMGTDGATPGRAVTPIDRKILDDQRPNWHTETGVAEVKHYSFDDRDPKHFYVYPPQPSSAFGYLELICSTSPPDVAAIADIMTLDDVYSNPLLDYILYRAYSKDAALSPTAPQRAVSHYGAFLASLGIKEKGEALSEPLGASKEARLQAQAAGA